MISRQLVAHPRRCALYMQGKCDGEGDGIVLIGCIPYGWLTAGFGGHQRELLES